MHGHLGWIVALTCISLFGGAVSAQTARSGGGASAQLVQQMQQLASERTALQAENDKLKKQLADITKDRDTLKTGQQAVERRAKDASVALDRSNSQRAAVDQELTQTKAKMQELIARFRETIVKLRGTESEATSAKQALAMRERELSTCVDRNKALYSLNGEVLTHYEKQSALARMAQIEPFTKIKRVENENLIDDYRSRAQDQLVTPPKGLPSSSAAPAAPAAGAPESAVSHAAGPDPQVSTPTAPTEH